MALVDTLSPDEVQALCGAMESLSAVDEADIEAVLADFIARARATNPLASAGDQAVRAVIERSLGPARANAILRAEGSATHHRVYRDIRWLSADDVADLVSHEHPQVAAVAIGLVDPAVAANALARLDEGDRADLLLRVAAMQPLGDAALDELQLAVAARLSAPLAAPVALGGTGSVAAVLNRFDRLGADRTLKLLAKHNRALASAIDEQRVTFDDVIALTDKELGAVVRASDAATLALAIKGLDEATGERLLGVMSKRAAQTLRDEMQDMTRAPRAEIEAAQAAMAATARRLAEDKAIRIGGMPDDD